MNQIEFSRELASFDEKISLAELEEAKAHERVNELKYHKARFNMDFLTAVCKQQAQNQENSEGN